MGGSPFKAGSEEHDFSQESLSSESKSRPTSPPEEWKFGVRGPQVQVIQC